MRSATLLHTKDLAIGYTAPRKPHITIAEHLNLSLKPSELVCLLGPNGVGKSTLMRTIAGMQKPLSGHIALSGEDITRLKPRQLASRLSIVLTDRPNLGLLNGYALVALGRHPHTGWTGRLNPHDEAVIQWAVDAVDATAFAERPVMELSDGQRQKLMIARALAQESQLLLLDEPTAYLDLPRRVEIMHLLHQLANETGRAILLSTHDLDLALRTADTLWLMSRGAVCVGTPEDLVLNGDFEAAFQGEGIQFDRETGTFETKNTVRQGIVVHGEGIPHMWTCRALKRAGYTVQNTNGLAPSIQITIYADDSHPIWHLTQNGTETVHHNIRGLLNALATVSIN